MADLSHWDFALNFTGEESAALIAGIEPARDGAELKSVRPVLARIKQSYEIAWGHHHDKYYPSFEGGIGARLRKDALESWDMLLNIERAVDHDGELQFANWLSEEASDFERQRFNRAQLTGWLNATGLSSVYRFNQQLVTVESSPAETTLLTRERNTLLTIIAVLCKEAKVPYDKPAKAAGMIQSTAATMGVSIGETTIEGHLKKVPDALATRMK